MSNILDQSQDTMEDARGSVERGQRAMEKGDCRGAVIELRNASRSVGKATGLCASIDDRGERRQCLQQNRTATANREIRELASKINNTCNQN